MNDKWHSRTVRVMSLTYMQSAVCPPIVMHYKHSPSISESQISKDLFLKVCAMQNYFAICSVTAPYKVL